MTIAEFSDPRLVAIYESVNPYGPGEQPDFYAGLAHELRARTIVDLGCGTGLITRALAARGYDTSGVEPSAAMVALARAGESGDRVRWIEGDASALRRDAADLAIMTGHVAQFFVTDESWRDALLALRRTVRPGGRLAFETRNPSARAWERWTSEHVSTVRDPLAGAIDTWTEVDSIDGDVVSFTNHYRFRATGDDIVSKARLRFRSENELRTSLADAGFEIERLYGDWDRRRAVPETRELIVVAG